MSRIFWICLAIAAANALISVGFSLAAIATAGSDQYVYYALGRSIPLALAALALIFFRSSNALTVLLFVLGAMQAADTITGALVAHDPAKTFGPAVLALITFAATIVLLIIRTRRSREL